MNSHRAPNIDRPSRLRRLAMTLIGALLVSGGFLVIAAPAEANPCDTIRAFAAANQCGPSSDEVYVPEPLPSRVPANVC